MSNNPIERAAAHFAAAELEANKAAIEEQLAAGVKLLVDDGTKLAEEADAKLGPVVAGAINGLLTQFAGSGETALDNLADAGVDQLIAFLHGIAGDPPADTPSATA